MNALTLQLDCPGERGFTLRLAATLPASGITAVYGPSGCGKTTLLDCIAGLRRPARGGTLRFGDTIWQQDGLFVPPWQRRVGYVFQDARLLPHLNVAGNLRYASSRAPAAPPLPESELVSLLGLAPLLDHRPAALSAGQRQRVALARALLQAPHLLLLDEPLANLDTAASGAILALLARLKATLPMLYVSHDIEEVSAVADHIALLADGELVDQGPLIDMACRLDSRLSQEEQAAAILVGEVTEQDAGYGLTGVTVEGHTLYVNHLDQPAGSRRRLRVPARDVSLCLSRPEDSSILNILPVTVAGMEPQQAARVLLRLQLGQQYLLARITRKSAEALALKPGDTAFAQIKSVALLNEGTQP